MKSVKILLILCTILLIAAIPTASNPWVIIKQGKAVYWIRHDSIVSVVDNHDDELARSQGKATIGLINGQELHFDKDANELMEIINR